MKLHALGSKQDYRRDTNAKIRERKIRKTLQRKRVRNQELQQVAEEQSIDECFEEGWNGSGF